MKKKDELIVIRIGNRFEFKRTTIDTVDAEELIRSLGQLEEQYSFMEKQLKDHKSDIDKIKRWEIVARDMRTKEVNDSKEEIRKYST